MNTILYVVMTLSLVLALCACQQMAEISGSDTQIQKVCKDNETNVNGTCVPKNQTASSGEKNLTSGVEAKNVTFAKGFLAKPKEPGKYPGIIMIHEWWGLNDNIRDMAKKLAQQGYVVFAVDLYDGQVTNDSGKAMNLSQNATRNLSSAISEMEKAVTYLKEKEGVTSVGSIGWCFGGGMSLQLAINEPLNATVIYYGNVTDDKTQLRKINGPILGIFGANDTNIPISSVNNFKRALDDLGIVNEIYLYPGVGHAFANPTGPNYAKNETTDAWNKTITFLDKYLKAGNISDAQVKEKNQSNQTINKSAQPGQNQSNKKSTNQTNAVNNTNATANLSAQVATVPGDSLKTFNLTAQDFSFKMNGEVSPTLRVKLGDRVGIRLTSLDGNHNWRLDEFGVASKIVGTGDSASAEFAADKKGTFEYYCGVANHRQMGMKGNLVVE